MNVMNLRENPRSKLSLRYGAIRTPILADKLPASATMPAAELRRFVATMID